MKKGLTYLKSTLFVLLFIGVEGCTYYAQSKEQKIYVIDFEELNFEKKRILSEDKEVLKNYKVLIDNAEKLLDTDFFSVVNKTGLPPSKDKHDYMSIAPYFWPNQKKSNGLPYIRKDGQVNPETRTNFTDYIEKNNFIAAVKTLTKAYFFSNDEKYATKNIEFINAWFIDEATKMNPNINYGQSVPGLYKGRCFGIIEFAGIVEVIKFLEVAKEKAILDVKTEKAMAKWFSEYVYWLQNSDLGKEEAARKNNHGTHYDVQLLNILIYLNKTEDVKNYLSDITKSRIFNQIETDGSQPLELARTKSFSYSVMNLHGFLELAIIGKKVGVNLWNSVAENGSCIKAGYQYMLPYLTGKKEWEYKQIKSKIHSEQKLVSDLKKVRVIFKEDAFDSVIQHYK